MIGWSANKSPDAAWQYETCLRQGIPMREIEDSQSLGDLESPEADLWVDALFGTGLRPPLRELFSEVASCLAQPPCPLVAVDLPSGLDANSGEIQGPCASADLTVTFAAPKWPHIFDPAAQRCGEIVIADLGIPASLVESAPGQLYLSTPETVGALLPVRAARSHKGDFGHCLLVAGSPGMSGAAVLATQAAVAAGAGLVTIAVPDELLVTLECASLESMSLGLDADEEGNLSAAASEEILSALEDRDALAIGPGLGSAPGTVESVQKVIAESCCPAVLDADALNALPGATELLRAREGVTVLTPHPGEASRMTGIDIDEIERDRIGFARQFAAEFDSVLVLKGHQTLIATPDGEVTVNTTGNPGMASGGCGDVLTGIVVALLAQKMEAEVAAVLGVYLHGLAGDLALETRGEEGLRASDLVERLPEAFELLRTP
jgi:NAD(P)H-hydrate epimerase